MYPHKRKGPNREVPPMNPQAVPQTNLGRWIVVANRTDARIFDQSRRGAKPALVKTVTNSESETGDQIQESIRSSSEDERAKGRPEYGEGLKKFARYICRILEQGRLDKEYDDLIVIAEAKFLGLLRDHMNQQVQRLISKELEKDLRKMSDSQIQSLFSEAPRFTSENRDLRE